VVCLCVWCVCVCGMSVCMVCVCGMSLLTGLLYFSINNSLPTRFPLGSF